LVLPSHRSFVYRRQADSITEKVPLCGPRILVSGAVSPECRLVKAVFTGEDSELILLVLFCTQFR
jgi:hypothetical protein